MGLFTKKSIGALQAEADRGLLRRSLGPWNLTALGIGSIIGTGIFVLTGTAASQNAGPALVFSMLLSAVGCAFAGLCYAEFAAMVPVAGSAYTYAYATIGEIFAWIIGWDLILEYALSTATVAVGWSGYFASLMHDVGVDVPASLTGPPGPFNLPAFAIVLVVAALLVIGIKQSADTNTVLVAIKAMVLVVFVIAGAAYVKRENLTPLIPPNTGEFGHFGWSGILRGAGVMFFAYIGFDAVSTAAQEASRPSRDMPIGILGSLAICTVIYILVAIVLLGIVPYPQLNVADPLAVGIDATGLRWLSPLIKVAALFGLFSTMIVTLLAQTRIFYSMSRDGLLPPMFSAVHPRFRTPHLSTMMTGIVIALVSGLTPISVLSQLVSIGTLLAFGLVCIGVILLRHTAPDIPRPFRTPGVPLVPILGAIICLAQMIGLPLATWERLVVWLAAGLVVYFTYSYRSSRLIQPELNELRPRI
ncbi:MAG TPA: amino acid permease [Vicinamibacterales bacterium]|jgi:APA family basic amino acid/polyamine antiporter|nr:amino acid permease [Vicinamibacterales bacterium]